MYDTATGQADLARLLKDLEGEDGGSIALQHLPANMPMAALVGCAIPTYGFSVDDFGKRAFDASNFGDKAGVFLSADEEEEAECKKNGGKLNKDIVADLMDAQEEYLEAWMQGSSTIAGLTLSNAEHDELSKRLKNDENFRNLVITQMLQENPNLSQAQADKGVSGYTELVSLYQKHPDQRSEAEQNRIQELEKTAEVKAAVNAAADQQKDNDYSAMLSKKPEEPGSSLSGTFLSQSNNNIDNASPKKPENLNISQPTTVDFSL